MNKSRRKFVLNAAQLTALMPVAALSKPVRNAGVSTAGTQDFGSSAEEAYDIAYRAHEELANYPGFEMHGDEQIAMLVYPGMTMLDLVGPQYFFASLMGATVHLVSADAGLAPVTGDTGFAIVPTIDMKECPGDVDVLFVPGGTAGTVDAMLDERTVDFVADRGSRARFVTSVCTGSLLLGQAGLLDGRKATSHWATHHLLPEFGATPVDARVVTDGNVVTGAGVSAGLDFALQLLAELRGVPYAKAIQLQAEYAPEPVFDAGTPDSIDPALGEPMHRMFATAVYAMREAAGKRRRRQ